MPDLRTALRDLVTRCDGPEGVRANGSNINTIAAHVALGDLGEVSRISEEVLAKASQYVQTLDRIWELYKTLPMEVRERIDTKAFTLRNTKAAVYWTMVEYEDVIDKRRAQLLDGGTEVIR